MTNETNGRGYRQEVHGLCKDIIATVNGCAELNLLVARIASHRAQPRIAAARWHLERSAAKCMHEPPSFMA